MRQSAKAAIIAGICAVVIIGGLALFVHFRLSEIEKNETEQERAQESAKDIATEAFDVLSGKEPHSESEESHSESEELESEKSHEEGEYAVDKKLP